MPRILSRVTATFSLRITFLCLKCVDSSLYYSEPREQEVDQPFVVTVTIDSQMKNCDQEEKR